MLIPSGVRTLAWLKKERRENNKTCFWLVAALLSLCCWQAILAVLYFHHYGMHLRRNPCSSSSSWSAPSSFSGAYSSGEGEDSGQDKGSWNRGHCRWCSDLDRALPDLEAAYTVSDFMLNHSSSSGGECYALWNSFLPFLSAAFAIETAKIVRQQH